MFYDSEAAREIHLIFQDDCSYLGDFLFRKGFKHVFAIERQALGWVCIDPSRRDCVSSILPAGYEDKVIETFAFQNPEMTVLSLTVNPNRRNWYPNLSIMGCVGAIQYLLGVYWPWIITPYQLYCKLINNQISHIKVGKPWVTEVQGGKPSEPPPSQDRQQQS